MNQNFSSNSIFEYNGKKKISNASLLLFFITIILLFGFFFPEIKSLFFLEKSIFNQIVQFFLNEIQNHTSLGLFFTSFLGGLFFLVFPLEIYFYSLLDSQSSFIMSVIPYFSGIFFAQILNYWFGLRLSRLTKILIPPKKFYKLKGYLNRWGIWMVFIINIAPLPSPVFSAVLGSFCYNFKRFILFMSLGSILLYSILFFFYSIIIKIGGNSFLWLKF
jgi:membrane protein YqaA with SNARE-associated domain